MKRTAAIALLVGVLACGEDAAPGSDAGSAAPVADAAAADVGLPDGGLIDVGVDAGPVEADAGPGDAGVIEPGRDAGAADGALPDPVIFVHGINGSSAEFGLMIERLIEDGWPADRLRALDFEDPAWGCNVDNASYIQEQVVSMLLATGAERIDLVAHSMGTLSSRYFVKNLGGTDMVRTYVTLGGLHHGNRSACLNPLPVCVWQELCPDNPFLTQLNADPVTPGDETHWVSIYSTDDGRVPTSSSMLDGAENIEVSGPPHAGPGGLLEDEGVYAEVKRVLAY